METRMSLIMMLKQTLIAAGPLVLLLSQGCNKDDSLGSNTLTDELTVIRRLSVDDVVANDRNNYDVNGLLSRIHMPYSSNGFYRADIEPSGVYDSAYEVETFTATFHDIRAGTVLGEFENRVGILTLSNDGKHFLEQTALYDELFIHDYNSNSPRAKLHAYIYALSNDGLKLIAANSSEIICYQVEGQELWSQSIPDYRIDNAVLSHDGKWAAVSASRRRIDPRGFESKLVFFDENGNEVGQQLESGFFSNLSFSTDGGHLFAVVRRGELVVLDFVRNELLASFQYAPATEYESVEVNKAGEVAATLINHPTQNEKGYYADKGLEDPRIALFWDIFQNRMSLYEFDKSLQIQRDSFVAKLSRAQQSQMIVHAKPYIYILE